MISNETELIQEYNPDLTLIGLNLIYQKQKRA